MTARTQNSPQFSESDIDFIVRLAKQRAALVKQLKRALEENKAGEVWRLARELCGLPPGESHEQRH